MSCEREWFAARHLVLIFLIGGCDAAGYSWEVGAEGSLCTKKMESGL